MDWSKVNFDEMGYVFKSTRSNGDLKCCPFSLKIDSVLDMLNYYQVEVFDHDDIHRLFQILRLKNSEGKVVIPSANKIKARLEKVDYKIEFCHDCYRITLEEGYKKGYIADWANWAIKNNDVCEALSRNSSAILKDMENLLLEYLTLSDKMRHGYIESIGKSPKTCKQLLSTIITPIPAIFQTIYSKYAGTPRTISNQQYMDFLPGYRLIHIEELAEEHHNLLQQLETNEVIIPLLADYASCYICYAKKRDGREYVCSYAPNEGLVEMHHSIYDFFKTIIAFYNEHVFFLDEEGFLDYDYEKEEAIGQKYNPDVAYWIEN